MANRKSPSPEAWFDNCGGWTPRHDLGVLRRGIEAGLLNAQDEYGMTALHLAIASGWEEGVAELLRAGTDTELRDHRTGETPLYTAVQERNEAAIAALVAADANPDVPNHWGVTPRDWAADAGAAWFGHMPRRETPLPTPRIQNAEHLADHYYPRFKIPVQAERETMRVGQAVDLYLFGPEGGKKQDRVKVRITARRGARSKVRYTAAVETLPDRTHLPECVRVVEFGPEHVASMYVPRPAKKPVKRKVEKKVKKAKKK